MGGRSRAESKLLWGLRMPLGFLRSAREEGVPAAGAVPPAGEQHAAPGGVWGMAFSLRDFLRLDAAQRILPAEHPRSPFRGKLKEKACGEGWDGWEEETEEEEEEEEQEQPDSRHAGSTDMALEAVTRFCQSM